MSHKKHRKPPITPHSRLWDGLSVGLLGGSFNPAHDGHKHIAHEALKRLGLDAVWLLVSPANPLKNEQDLSAYTKRYQSAQAIADHAQIMPTDIEAQMGSRYTLDSLLGLFKAFPKTHFIWLMGADNMQQFSSWYQWQMIADNVPIAVFDRPSYSMGALTSDLARRYANFRVAPKYLAHCQAPAWSFVTTKRHPASATHIRQTSGAI